MEFYTADTGVIDVMASAWPMLTVFVFFDCMQGVASGQISGLNMMGKVKWVTGFNYWVLGIPISCVLMFHYNLGIAGLWVGPTIACLMNYILYEYHILGTDW